MDKILNEKVIEVVKEQSVVFYKEINGFTDSQKEDNKYKLAQDVLIRNSQNLVCYVLGCEINRQQELIKKLTKINGEN